jgi:hypothetical protein
VITYITAFVLSFCAIFMKGFAQQNMIHRRKGLMLPTSWLLATAEMFTAGIFVTNYLESSVSDSIILALVIGTGGGIGCIMSLDFHGWLTKKIYKWDIKGEEK